MAVLPLEVRGLVTELATERGPLRAVDGVDLSLLPGRTLALVGESGCGKTLTALSILQLLPAGGRLVQGSVRLAGEELVGAKAARLQQLRGNRLAMIFQEPMSALNPVLTVGAQLAEGLQIHQGLGAAEARMRAVALLAEEGFDAPERQAAQYPHQLSGGMRQRVLIAMALACAPDVLMADEPTSALDAGIQQRLFARLAALRQERGLAMLWVTHDLVRARAHADELAVMYAGRIVERGPAQAVLARPRHPYTQALWQCALHVGGRDVASKRSRLPTIPGAVAGSMAWRAGCAYRERCPRASERCAQIAPILEGGAHPAACHHPLLDGDAGVWA
jgi:peptide/nickel transport system ATP-binding protein